MDERLVGACGLVCSECEAYAATQAGDEARIAALAADWSKQFGVTLGPDAVRCDGCMGAGERRCGHCAECDVRLCALGRGLENCAGCDDFGCEVLERFLAMAGDGPRAVLEELRG